METHLSGKWREFDICFLQKKYFPVFPLLFLVPLKDACMSYRLDNKTINSNKYKIEAKYEMNKNAQNSILRQRRVLKSATRPRFQKNTQKSYLLVSLSLFKCKDDE